MDAVVVGGGIAGLVAANRLVDAGVGVTLIERQPALGGRARSDEHEGFVLNQGPHALYNAGALSRSLRSLGVAVSGAEPDLSKGVALHQGEVVPFPAGPVSLLRSPLFGLRAKRQLVALLARLTPRPALAGVAVSDWIDGAVPDSTAAAFVRALVRLTSYAGALDVLSAEAASAQLALSTKRVRYLDGGWGTIAGGLEARARDAGLRTERGQVQSIRREGSRWVVVSPSATHVADVVVVALASEASAARLLADEAPRVVSTPSHVAVLDVGLTELPVAGRQFALSLDSPHYASVHSPPARLSERGVLVSAMEYLTGGSDRDARSRLEAVMDRFQPGWRERLVTSRYLPKMTVSSAIPDAGGGGLPGRAPVVSVEHPGIFFAGDWAGPAGMLADASAASAELAAVEAGRHLSMRR